MVKKFKITKTAGISDATVIKFVIASRNITEWYRTNHVSAMGARIYPYELMADQLDAPEKVAYRAMERAHKRGYIEYGVSLRTGWPTPEGLALIKGDAQ